MINIVRKQKAPECLEIEKQKEISGKKEGKYDCGEVKSILKREFLNKCYICETSKITDLQIEHFEPHQKKNIELKFDWNNLFFSCSYCNGKKSNNYNTDNYNRILDCTKVEQDVENWIIYRKTITLKSKFDISVNEKLVEKDFLKETQNTVNLLNNIYNGNQTTKEKTENLNDKIYGELKYFQNAIEKYFSEIETDKNLKRIKFKLSRKSDYVSFKRWIVKENYPEFIQYFD